MGEWVLICVARFSGVIEEGRRVRKLTCSLLPRSEQRLCGAMTACACTRRQPPREGSSAGARGGQAAAPPRLIRGERSVVFRSDVFGCANSHSSSQHSRVSASTRGGVSFNTSSWHVGSVSPKMDTTLLRSAAAIPRIVPSDFTSEIMWFVPSQSPATRAEQPSAASEAQHSMVATGSKWWVAPGRDILRQAKSHPRELEESTAEWNFLEESTDPGPWTRRCSLPQRVRFPSLLCCCFSRKKFLAVFKFLPCAVFPKRNRHGSCNATDPNQR